jgi:hypothetical protein
MNKHKISMVFSGGVSLGSYQAGAFEALQEDAGIAVGWIAAPILSILLLLPAPSHVTIIKTSMRFLRMRR